MVPVDKGSGILGRNTRIGSGLWVLVASLLYANTPTAVLGLHHNFQAYAVFELKGDLGNPPQKQEPCHYHMTHTGVEISKTPLL